MPDTDDSGTYPVWANHDDEVRGIAPTTHTSDPIAAAHWDEGLWQHGAIR